MNKLVDAFLKWTKESDAWEVIRVLFLLTLIGLLLKSCSYAWAWFWV